MLTRFNLIVAVLFIITLIGRSGGNDQCCKGYIREFDHAAACYWFEDGRCCADNAIYSKKHGELIGTTNARAISEDTSDFCRQCFRDIVEC